MSCAFSLYGSLTTLSCLSHCNLPSYSRPATLHVHVPADAVREEGGLLRACQLLQLHPLTLQHLVLAALNVKVQRSQAADKVEVRAVEGIGHVMVLAEGQKGLKLWTEERLQVAMLQATEQVESWLH